MHPMHEHDDGGPFAATATTTPAAAGRSRPRGPRRPPCHRGGRGRAPRGDVRAAILLLLAEEPMHGYQLMQAIAERSGGRWTPEPRRDLPDDQPARGRGPGHRHRRRRPQAGHAHRRRPRARRGAPGVGTTRSPASAAGPGADLRGLLEQLHGAVRQVARSGTEAQLTAAAGHHRRRAPGAVPAARRRPRHAGDLIRSAPLPRHGAG